MVIGIDASRAFVEKPTGTERYAFEVITRILRLTEAKEHEWILYVKGAIPSEVEGSFDSLRSLRMTIQRIPLPYLWTQVGLAARTWIDDLDVLWVPAHTLPVLRKPGLKTVVTIHGIEYEWLPAYENKLQRWYLPLSTQYAVKYADKLIAVSDFTKKQLIVRLNGDQKKIKVIWEGYEQNGQLKIDNGKLKNGLKVLIGNNILPKKYILFVGTVQPRKNLERLIEAFARLPFDSAQGDKLKLVIAGKLGWNYQGVMDAPKKWGVEDRVVILGYVDDYTREILFKNALVYVQPSVTEGFGLPVLEAMSFSVPVVSSNGGALAEVVGEAGLLFDPFDVRDIGHKLALVLNNHKLREELIWKGNKRVGDFGWDKAARETYKYLTN